MTDGRVAPVRNVLSHVLQGELNESATNEVGIADGDLDAALDCLEQEEPTLIAWLEQDPDLHRMLDATMTAIARLIYRDAEAGQDYNFSMSRVSHLIFRLLCATSQYAVRQDRPLALGSLRLMKELIGDGIEPEDSPAVAPARIRPGRRRVRSLR